MVPSYKSMKRTKDTQNCKNKNDETVILKHKCLFNKMTNDEFGDYEFNESVNIKHFWFKVNRLIEKTRYFKYELVKKLWP